MYIPIWQSYFSATPESAIWRFLSWHIRPEMNQWWEQFLFPGAIPYLGLLLLPLLFYNKSISVVAKKFILFLTLTLFLSILFSLNIKGFTLYKWLYEVPGFGSLRGMNRLINAEIIFFILLFVFVFKFLMQRYKSIYYFVSLLPLLVIVDNSTTYWERRYNKVDAQWYVNNIKGIIQTKYDSSRVAIAFQSMNFLNRVTESHLDVMLATQELGIPCVNAYTGLFPDGFQGFFDAEGKDSLFRWLSIKNIDTTKVDVINEYDLPFINRSFYRLQAGNGLMISADLSSDFQLKAISSDISHAEKFEILRLDEGKDLLRISNGNFVCADLAQKGVRCANRPGPGDWERFTINFISNDKITLKALNGNYIGVNIHDSTLNVHSPEINQMQIFELVK
ncbi:MAG: hypothetical protein IPP46_01280 [Bacteroidetes bacterium]|nr:hypothetical protein [Bacteroidota bacterium]